MLKYEGNATAFFHVRMKVNADRILGSYRYLSGVLVRFGNICKQRFPMVKTASSLRKSHHIRPPHTCIRPNPSASLLLQRPKQRVRYSLLHAGALVCDEMTLFGGKNIIDTYLCCFSVENKFMQKITRFVNSLYTSYQGLPLRVAGVGSCPLLTFWYCLPLETS